MIFAKSWKFWKFRVKIVTDMKNREKSSKMTKNAIFCNGLIGEGKHKNTKFSYFLKILIKNLKKLKNLKNLKNLKIFKNFMKNLKIFICVKMKHIRILGYVCKTCQWGYFGGPGGPWGVWKSSKSWKMWNFHMKKCANLWIFMILWKCEFSFSETLQWGASKISPKCNLKNRSKF